MQYTLRNIPKKLDQALRARAKASGRSINQTAIEAMKSGLGVGDSDVKRDLSFMGHMDDETLKAIEEVRQESERIWPEDWDDAATA